MAEQYYGGAPNAFLGGIEFGADKRKRVRHENALTALIEQYGPEAADPAALASLQQTQQSAEMHPYEVAQAEQQKAAQDRALRLQAGRRAGAVLKLTKDRGGDLGGAFDFVAEALPTLGIPAENLAQIRETLVSNPDSVDEFIALLQDPDKHADGTRAVGAPVAVYSGGKPRLLQYFTDGTSKLVSVDGEDVEPAATVLGEGRLSQGRDRINNATRKLTNDELKQRGYNATPGYEYWIEDGRIVGAPIPGTKQEEEATTKIRDSEQADSKFLRTVSVVSRRGDVVQENAQRAINYFEGANGGLFLQNIRRGAKLVPGTEMYNAWQALEAVKNNVAVEEMDELRKSSQTGASGFGSLTAPELDLLKGARGGLSQINDPAILVSTLRSIIEDVAHVKGLAQADADAAKRRMAQRRQRNGADLQPPRAPARSAAPAPNAATVDYSTLSDEDLARVFSGSPQ